MTNLVDFGIYMLYKSHHFNVIYITKKGDMYE
jgi:hypothetical protein